MSLISNLLNGILNGIGGSLSHAFLVLWMPRKDRPSAEKFNEFGLGKLLREDASRQFVSNELWISNQVQLALGGAHPQVQSKHSSPNNVPAAQLRPKPNLPRTFALSLSPNRTGPALAVELTGNSGGKVFKQRTKNRQLLINGKRYSRIAFAPKRTRLNLVDQGPTSKKELDVDGPLSAQGETKNRDTARTSQFLELLANSANSSASKKNRR